MLISDLAEAILGKLHADSFRVDRREVKGNPRHDIQTPTMLQATVVLLFPKNETLFAVAQSLFPPCKGMGPHLFSYSAKGELTINVYFPLPYASAERFGTNARGRFIERMAAYIIDQAVRAQMATSGYASSVPPFPDPRHPDEIRILQFKKRIATFFKRLTQRRKKSAQRRFNEYL